MYCASVTCNIPSRWLTHSSSVRLVGRTSIGFQYTLPNSYISVQDVVTHIWRVSQNVSCGICTHDVHAITRWQICVIVGLHAPSSGIEIHVSVCVGNAIKIPLFPWPLMLDVNLKQEIFIRYVWRAYLPIFYEELGNSYFSVNFLHLSGHVARLLLFRTGVHSLFCFQPP